MKVVLFCGGLGMRLREYSDGIPKPMVPIGYRPVLWHVMKYYAYYGHTDFVLCLGYKADVVKRYFLNYDESISNDFVLDGARKGVPELLHRDIDDWRITFCDTGLASNIGQRLRAVRKHLEGEEYFYANYADGLTDLPLDEFSARFVKSGKIASFVTVKPTQSFHVVSTKAEGLVEDIQDLAVSNIQINGGYFMFKNEIFDHIRAGEELVNEPFQRLIKAEQLVAYEHKGFWQCMDTFKDKQHLDQLFDRGEAPWELWKGSSGERRSNDD